MTISYARVRTEHASRYLVQLSKHWSHKFPELAYDQTHADIPLPGAPCFLDAATGHLDIRITTGTEADAGRFEQVVADHLKRFAFKEDLTFEWTRSEA